MTSNARLLGSRRNGQRTFYGGDLQGITDSLDYLSSLGVTILYLNPIFEGRSCHRYDTVDHLRIDPMLGTREDFEVLCREAKSRGMKIVLDGVFNHTSLDHPWYRSSSLRRRYYLMKNETETMTWMNGGGLPKLDTENPRVLSAIRKTIEAWPEADGWRLDAAHLLPERCLREIRGAAGTRKIVIEDWEHSAHYFRKGLADSVTNFLFRDAMERYFIEDLAPETLVERLRVWIEGYPRAQLPWVWNFLDNHDTARLLGRVGRERFFRAAVFLFTLPGTPMVFHGDEVGLGGGGARKNHDAGRQVMPWNERWWDRGILEHFRALASFRKRFGPATRGRFRVLAAENGSRTVVWEMEWGGYRIYSAVNDGYRGSRVPGMDGRRVRLKPGEWIVRGEDREGEMRLGSEQISYST